MVGNEIRVAAGADLDHETADSHSVTVQVTDSGGNTHSETVTLSVNNLVDGITVTGTAGDDSLSGSVAEDTISGLGGDDVIAGDAGADTLDGGTGTDELDYSGSSAGVNVNLNTNTVSGGDAEGDTISNFENVTGSDHADTLTGDAGDNVLDGGAGADALDGGAGTDTVDYSASTAGVTVDISAGTGSGRDCCGRHSFQHRECHRFQLC